MLSNNRNNTQNMSTKLHSQQHEIYAPHVYGP